MNVLHPNYIQEHGHVIQKANIPFPFLLKGLLYIKWVLLSTVQQGMRDKQAGKKRERSR